MEQEIARIDLGNVNCYLVRQGGNFFLIDTGGHLFLDKKFDNGRQTLETELKNHGCDTANLKLVILTHGHNDHAASAAFIREKYNAKIAMHPDDVNLVENPTLEKVMGDCKYLSLVNKLVFAVMKGPITKLSKKILDDFERFTPDILTEEGVDLSPYGFNAKVIHIPGHTKGSIGILAEQRGLFVGDVFINQDKPAIAPNAYDYKILKDSIKRIKSMNIKTIYPGHGTPFDAVLIK